MNEKSRKSGIHAIGSKREKEPMDQTKQHLRLKLENIFSHSNKMESLDLASIIDAQAIQSLMDDFYKLAHIPIGIIDLEGNVLVGVGWQDICTRFHRAHPEACKHCIESDIKLSAGVTQGEFKLYRCKNNMWDIATPIIVCGQHFGNIFLGQFFFEDEPLDYELFRSQARKYGFNEEEYIAALEKVPRFSRETVDTIMVFFMKLANVVSNLGYSNIKLAQSLEERNALVEELKQAEESLIRSENEFRTLAENSPDVIARFDRQKRYIYTNPAISVSGFSPEEIIEKTSGELGIDPGIVKLWEEHIENVFSTGKPEEIEFDYISPQGKEYYFNTRIIPEFINGKVVTALAISRDITDTKKAEDESKETLGNLEKLVKERTMELEKAYNSLKESEKGLAEAQKMAHIGNWEWNIAADEAYWSDEMYRIFRRDPRKLAPPYNEYISYVHPDDRDLFNSSTERAVNGKPYSIEYRIILPDREERIIHMQSQVIFDENNTSVRIKGTIQDITERKKAEKALDKIQEIHIKEIHHRIKNNLQVISSLLDLQAEKFSSKKCIKDSDVLSAFRESQDRITSIALIHEELHGRGGSNTLYFSPYLEKLAENLFKTYSIGNVDISLNMDLEDDIFFDMDTAVPLGIIINELISNSLKYAFRGRSKGNIRIKLYRDKGTGGKKAENESGIDEKLIARKGTGYTLIVSDDGTGIPEEISFKNSDTLGLQLVNILVDQLDGELRLKRDNGTEFIIKINLQQTIEKPSDSRIEPEITGTSS